MDSTPPMPLPIYDSVPEPQYEGTWPSPEEPSIELDDLKNLGLTEEDLGLDFASGYSFKNRGYNEDDPIYKKNRCLLPLKSLDKTNELWPCLLERGHDGLHETVNGPSEVEQPKILDPIYADVWSHPFTDAKAAVDKLTDSGDILRIHWYLRDKYRELELPGDPHS